MVIFNREALIRAIIRELGCSQQEAIKMMNYAKDLDDTLQPVLDAWIEDGRVLDFSVNDVDLRMVMDKLGTSFLPALFHMNRFVSQPDETERFKRLRVMNRDVSR